MAREEQPSQEKWTEFLRIDKTGGWISDKALQIHRACIP